MTTIDKAVKILKSTNNGHDLPVHHKKIVEAALRDDLGGNTGAKVVFESPHQ